MYLELQQKLRAKFVQAVEAVFGLKIAQPSLGYPPSIDLGELSITACFELAKQLRQPPRKIAEQLAPRLLPLEGVERVSIAGAGYLNLHLDRAAFAAGLFQVRAVRAIHESPLQSQHASAGKILVEHTSINPNKAAHIGHLRNAVLGDTFARLLRFRGHEVEIQNYIDNTGVQVADVVVGFVHLENKNLEDVRKLTSIGAARHFDYYCWDLYAQVFRLYGTNPEALAWRAEALKGIEEGRGDYAAMAELVSTEIVRRHLKTMERIGVQYDLLVQESEILKLDFWKSAFELMKEKGAIRYEDARKNRGCWVMSLDDSGAAQDADHAEASGEEPEAEEGVKVIVRSNGTVTYVGKDIAYHLWKFSLLKKDFGYEPFYGYANGNEVWRTTVTGEPAAPRFGHAARAYAVIDARQSYVQSVVAAAFRALGYKDQAANLHHFAYEVVGLSIPCATELGLPVGEEEQKRGYVDVSGRKGWGVKADDFINILNGKAVAEVQEREMTDDAGKQGEYGRMIAVAALRYFLVKFTRRTIIAFDFKEALAFEGETGPYLQYTVVRARSIFRKLQEAQPGLAGEFDHRGAALPADQLKRFLGGEVGRDFWELVLLAAQLEMTADQAIAAEEPAIVAKYAFRLAQAFNNFYHHHRILSESDRSVQSFLLFIVRLTSATLARALDLLGIDVPERM